MAINILHSDLGESIKLDAHTLGVRPGREAGGDCVARISSCIRPGIFLYWLRL